MFKNWIPKTVPFASDVDRELYNNIKLIEWGEPFGQKDYSFEATARAILGDRVSDCFTIRLVAPDIAPMYDRPLLLTIHRLNDSDYCFSPVEGFSMLKDLSSYLSRQTGAKIEVHVNETTQSSVITVGEMDRANYNSVYHLIQAFLPRYCPWFFNDKPLTDLEERFLKSLTKKSSDEYLRLLVEISKGFGDRKRALLEAQVSSLGKVLNEKRIQAVQQTIEDINNQIKDNQRQYLSLIRDLQEEKVFLCGLESQLDGADEMSKELCDYLSHNKHIEIEKVCTDSGKITFVALGVLNIYDPDLCESMQKNGSLYRFSASGNFSNPENQKKMTDACFGDNAPFAIKVCARYTIDLSGSVEVCSHEDYSAYPDYVPNPHIWRWGCLGTYREPIQSALRAGDPIQAIEQCLGSAQSINLGETGQTFYPFMTEVLKSKSKIILMPDGSSATPVEAFKWLNEQGE